MGRHLLGSFVLFLLIGVSALAFDVHLTRIKSATIVVPDDFLTIQEVINSAADGDTIFVKVGTYYEHVVVNKTVSIIGEDVDTTVIDGNGTGHVINVINDNVSISGFTVQNSGNIHMPNLDAGICLNDTTGCTISENRAINNDFCAISLLYSNGNTIIDNNLSSAGWGGIHLLSSSHNIISGNNITDKYGGINGHVSTNYNNITENTISNCTYGGFYHAASYNNICRNNISTIAVEGIWLQDQVNYNIVAENNLINSTVAIRVQGPNYNNTLLRNFIAGAEYGIKLEDYARYTRIADNIIVNNLAGNDSWSAGIRLDSGWDSEINLNIISGNRYGILLYSFSPRVSVSRNNITDNEYGLRVASGGSNYVNVSDNIVMNNRGYGIGLTGFGGASNYATISRNLIVNNSDGITLGQYSNYNWIFQNNISQNDYGFYIEYSTQNTIWNNNILNNDQQVYMSTGLVNNWDGGYPAGGNYWSGYLSPDLFSGPYQNITGGDGIGDNPYVIDANNEDNYPFMLLSICNVSQIPAGEIIPSGEQVEIDATITHLYSVERAMLNYTITNSTGTFNFSLDMTNAEGDVWNATIPAFPLGTNITYMIIGHDSEGNTINSQQQGYTLEYQIIPEFPSVIILAPLAIATLWIAIVSKRKTGKNPKTERRA
jgi:parallel beta-helix repeat protein